MSIGVYVLKKSIFKGKSTAHLMIRLSSELFKTFTLSNRERKGKDKFRSPQRSTLQTSRAQGTGRKNHKEEQDRTGHQGKSLL